MMGNLPQQFLFAPQFLARPQTHIAVTDVLFPCSVFSLPSAELESFSSTCIIAMPGSAAAKCCPWEVGFEQL